jgi:type II secretion system protein D
MPAIRTSLVEILSERIQFQQQDGSKIFLQANGQMAMLEFDSEKQQLAIEGTDSLVSDVARVASRISGIATGVTTSQYRILPLHQNGQTSLSRAGLVEVRGEPGDAAMLPRFQATFPGRLASMQQAAPGGQAAGPAAAMPQQNQNAPQPQLESEQGGTAPRGLPLQQFEGVEVEMLPEIDAIILRGRDQQLEDLAEIIKQLDAASQEAMPNIEVVPLVNTNSQRVAELIDEAKEDLVGTRQGRVTVTPLSKPNALLLIGWGDAVLAVKELIIKLDQPVAPETQFEVFQLEHAVATDVQTQLQSFFEGRDGLAPIIQSTVDSRTNAIVVHSAPRDLLEVRRLIARLDVASSSSMEQVRVFTLQNSLAADVAQTLEQALARSTDNAGSNLQLIDDAGAPIATSGILGSAQITVNERNNTIIVTSAASNLALIDKLIQQLDTPGMVAKIKIFPIYNGDAGALVETLRALIPSQAPGSQPSPQLSSSPEESSLVPLRFTVDARGNNIIAVGSEGDLRIVEALIVRLDESDTMQRKSTVYQLKNSPAVDVALAINEFLRSKRQVETATPGSNNPFEQLEKEVVVVPEPVQNKLILSATPRYYEEVSRLIEQLDQQPPQVMIQVLIAEVVLGDTDEFGIELGLQNSVLFDRSLLGDLLTTTNSRSTSTPGGVVTETIQDVLAASNVPGFNFNSTEQLGNSGSGQALSSAGQVGGQGISNFSVGRNSEQAGFGGLVLSASSENVSFLLRALEETRRLDVLSRPQVLTLDNQQAFIQVGQRVPRIVNSIINQNGAQNNVELENVGLIIGVTPRISPEGNVVMEIDAEKSELGAEAEGIPVSISADGTVIRSPRVDTITAQATVSAADNETIILGGLIAERRRQLNRKVPWLGDLPVLKHMFSYNYYDAQRTELLIIMTPHIVRNQNDMERLKQAEFARMSWCEADVFDVHGDVYLPANMNTEMIENGDWNTIYPDLDPRGVGSPPVIEAAPMPSFEVVPQPNPLGGLPVPQPGANFNVQPTTSYAPPQGGVQTAVAVPTYPNNSNSLESGSSFVKPADFSMRTGGNPYPDAATMLDGTRLNPIAPKTASGGAPLAYPQNLLGLPNTGNSPIPNNRKNP